MNILRALGREVGHGGNIPRGYHMAWYEPRRRLGVYYPAPLHWVLRAIRELRYRLRMAWNAPGIEIAEVFGMQRVHRERERLAEEYARGYMVGWHECLQTCLEAADEEIARANDVFDDAAILPAPPKPRRRN